MYEYKYICIFDYKQFKNNYIVKDILNRIQIIYQRKYNTYIWARIKSSSKSLSGVAF